MNNENTTKYRKEVWEKEYKKRFNLPSSNTDYPSRTLVNFLEIINPSERRSALDLGSGNGRNSIYLTQQGYKKVLGVEFSETAVEMAKKKISVQKLTEKIEFRNQSVGDTIIAQDNSFDLIIDMMVMHSLTKEDRDKEILQVIKLLKPGGYFVFHTLSAESDAAQKLIAENPGPESNSYRLTTEKDVITEKAFTEPELSKLLSPLRKVSLKSKVQETPAFGSTYQVKYFSGVFKKI